MRRAAKIDANQPRLVKFLEALGALVWDASAMGQGFPDLIVGWRGEVYLVEVKNDAMPPSGRKLTAPEQAFHDRWKWVIPDRLHVVKDEDEILVMLGMIEKGEVINGPQSGRQHPRATERSAADQAQRSMPAVRHDSLRNRALPGRRGRRLRRAVYRAAPG